MGAVSETSQALPFLIRVLDGPLSVEVLMDGQPAGVAKLEGRSGPYRPIAFEGEQRVKTTWYPGNPEASQQLVGGKLNPTTLNGTWKDRYLGDGAAKRLEILFERIRAAGPSLEITWGDGLDDVGFSVFGEGYRRVGVLSKFKTSPDRPQDVAWEMTFDWRSKGESSVAALTATAMANPREGVRGMVEDLRLAADAHEAWRDGLLFGLRQDVDRALSEALLDVASAVDKVEGVTALVTTTAAFPAGAARALLGAADLGLSAVERLEGAVLSLDPSRAFLPTDLATDLLRFKNRLFDLLGLSARARDSSRSTADQARDQSQPDLLAEVMAPAGVDLRDLALRFYGDADAWWAIANENDLPTSRVPDPPSGPGDAPARALRIPRLQAGPASDLRQNC